MTKQEFMAMSLPYRLKCKEIDLNVIFNFSTKTYDLMSMLNFDKSYKPILRPLSDISEPCLLGNIRQINQFSRVDKPKIIECGNDYEAIQCLSFYIVELLVKWHFDICGLIESGEAVDYHTLPDFVF